MTRPEFDKSLFPHWNTIKVRFRDLDPLNHVNNAIFSTYYEEARIHFIQQVPEFSGQLENGYSFILANIQIDFIKPVEFPAKLLTGTGIKNLGNSSISSFQAIYDDHTKKLISTAQASGVWFDLNNQRPARIPDIDHSDKLILDPQLFDS